MEQIVKISYFANSQMAHLSKILYDEEYFGFLENAEDYVLQIVDFIYTIPVRKRKLCKNPRRGKFFCSLKHNRTTTWFISFDMEDGFYIVKNICNNHSKDYVEFIAGGL